MTRNLLRRVLTWCVVAILLLPALLAVVLGLGALLAALGDAPAAAVCGRVSLGLGVLLVVVLLATTATSGLALLAPPPRDRRGRRRRRRRPRQADRSERMPGPP